MINVTKHGVTKPYKEKLHLYLAQARFLLDKNSGRIDFGRYQHFVVYREHRSINQA